ncbi:hypothetical protein OOU_Y34scaffold00015g3 [Pyricularia oryzae Y34]|uniref:Uncharacterized protein n=1 Tax=Pyricularia oryzae (strain Y34) TaxID=1143189 RepID=A0AA97PAV6_PYRO3|nr:hypothetical protein OOU_Y34scaffold00015g3 [Pyricularia oryzae Y34]
MHTNVLEQSHRLELDVEGYGFPDVLDRLPTCTSDKDDGLPTAGILGLEAAVVDAADLVGFDIEDMSLKILIETKRPNFVTPKVYFYEYVFNTGENPSLLNLVALRSRAGFEDEAFEGICISANAIAYTTVECSGRQFADSVWVARDTTAYSALRTPLKWKNAKNAYSLYNLGRATTHQQRQQDRGWHHVTRKFCAVEDEMPVARHGLDGLICDVGHSESEARRVLGCGCYFIGGQIFIHVLITASRGPVSTGWAPQDGGDFLSAKVVELPRQRRSLAQLEWVAGEPRLVDNGATAAPRAPSVSLCMDRNRRLAHWITAYLWKRGQAVVGSVNATTALLRAAKRKFTGINRGDRPLMPSPYGTNN